MRKKMYTIPKICRTGDDGEIIAYLGSNKVVPNLGLVESIIGTLRMAWLPFGLHYGKASSERVRDAAIWSIARLEGQIALIRDKFDIAPTQMLQAYPYQSGIQAPVTSAVEDKGEESTSREEVNENLDIDLGEEFDFTQDLLRKLS
ncbi:MAG: hypothetical protein AAF915_28290 [Cyanobacteria bacterium P01_D01_bin.50]